MTSPATSETAAARAALVLAAHGERNVDAPNTILAGHARALGELFADMPVTCGVLNGEPPLDEVLADALSGGVSRILVYPFFMSAGYFTGSALPEKIAALRARAQMEILAPLGVEPALRNIMLNAALRTAGEAGFDPAATRLLVVGHGSRSDSASAEATAAIAEKLEKAGQFAEVSIALLEEAPFIGEQLARAASPVVVSGFFAGDGMHAARDVPEAVAKSPVPAVYAGPVGAEDEIRGVIAKAVRDCLEVWKAEGTSA